MSGNFLHCPTDSPPFLGYHLCAQIFLMLPSFIFLFHTLLWYKHKILLSLRLSYKQELIFFFSVALMPPNFLKTTANCWIPWNSLGFFKNTEPGANSPQITNEGIRLLELSVERVKKKNPVRPVPACPVPTVKGSQTVTTERIFIIHFSVLWKIALS